MIVGSVESVSSGPEDFHLRALPGRVEGWRAGVARSPDPHHVSSPLHVARNVRISRIARPHLLHAKAYGTYPAGATFGPSRTLSGYRGRPEVIDRLSKQRF